MQHYSDAVHINVGTGEDQPIRELAEMVRRVVHPGATIVYDRTKPDGMPKKQLDVSRLHRLGWRHTTALADGHPDDVRLVPGQPCGRARSGPGTWCLMPLRVAFDLDGTVADMYSTLHQEALKLFGPETLAKAAYKKPVAGGPRCRNDSPEQRGRDADAPGGRHRHGHGGAAPDRAPADAALGSRQEDRELLDDAAGAGAGDHRPHREGGAGAPVGSHFLHDPAVNRRRDDAAAVAALARSARLSVPQRLRRAALAREDRRCAAAGRLR